MMAMGNYQVVARELYKFSTKGGMALSPMAIGMDVAYGVSPDRLETFEEQAKTAILRDAVNFHMPRFLGKFDLPDLCAESRPPVGTLAPGLAVTATLCGPPVPAWNRT